MKEKGAPNSWDIPAVALVVPEGSFPDFSMANGAEPIGDVDPYDSPKILEDILISSFAKHNYINKYDKFATDQTGFTSPRSRLELYNSHIEELTPKLSKEIFIESRTEIKSNHNHAFDYSGYIDPSQLAAKSLTEYIQLQPTYITPSKAISYTAASLLRNSSGFNPSLLSINKLPSAGVRYFDITAERLPEMALPVLAFIEQVQPHVIIGCDRGGRLFSVALHSAWQQTRQGQTFPTVDGKIHFTRISKAEDESVLQQKVDAIIADSLKNGQQRGNVVADDEQLRVLFVDDWVIGGGTKRISERLVAKYNAQSYFVVMCGEGADASGGESLYPSTGWRDDPDTIGVNYISTMHLNTDDSVSQTLEVVPMRTQEAKAIRQRIHQAARTLGQSFDEARIA